MRKVRDDEIEREIRTHLDTEAEDRIADGLTEDEAHHAARRAFGNVTSVKEDVRSVWTSRLAEDVTRDVQYAVRALARNPVFTIVSVLTLALGIGASTAIFSVVGAVLVRPLPYPTADRLAYIIENVPAEESFTGRPMRLPAMNPAEVEWWRTNATSFEDFAVSMPETRTMMTREGTVRLSGARVSPALFSMRMVGPIVGRWLSRDDDRTRAQVVVLNEATWRRYFGAASDVVDRSVIMDGEAHTIVGVMPASFGNEAFWMPYVPEPPRAGAMQLVQATALLRDGVSLEAAAVEVQARGAQLRSGSMAGGLAGREASANESHSPRFEVARLADAEVARVRPPLLLLVVAVAVVLLIVCANLANLLLVRGTGRFREIAVRQALGAARSRIVRQLLTEGVVLSLVGGAAGVGLAYVGVSMVRTGSVIEIPGQFRNALGPLGTTILPRSDEVAVDVIALAFALGLSVLTGLLFALAPALRLSRADYRQAIGTADLAARGDGAGAGRRLGHALAIAQLGLATTLLIAGGLLLHSFINVSTVTLGFEPATQIFQLVMPGEYPRTRRLSAANELAVRLEALPGVERAGFINMPPFTGQGVFRNLYLPPAWEAERDRLGEEDRTLIRGVSPGYLPALGARLLQGRWLEDRDGAGDQRVMLVNQSWVKRFSPDVSPVGTTVTFVTSGRERRRITWEVVGVIDDLRWRIDDGTAIDSGRDYPLLGFADLRQLFAINAQDSPDRPSMELDMLIGSPGGVGFALRVNGDPLPATTLRSVARGIDAAAAVDGVTTMSGVVAALTGRSRFYAVIISLFAGIAAVIAAIGIYGVLAYTMTQRQREFGVRLAMGADPRQILGLAMRQGGMLVAIGITLGLAGAAGMTRYLAGMLVGVTPLDARTYAVVVVAFTLTALCAAYIPARRATLVDPLVVLRYE